MRLLDLLPFLASPEEQSLIVADDFSSALFDDIPDHVTKINTPALGEFAPSELFNHSILVVSPALDAASLEHCIAKLRDQVSRHTIAIVIEPSEFGAAGFVSLGFDKADSPDGLSIYSFSIDTYKPAPDWLNSRFWAHPERFDKFRW